MADYDTLLAFLRDHLELDCGGDIHVLRRSVDDVIQHLEEGTDTLYALVVDWGQDAGPGHDGQTRWQVVESETGAGPVFAAGTVTGFSGLDEGEARIAQAVRGNGFELYGTFMYGLVGGTSTAIVRRIARGA
jgi:hypothetical protein